MRLVHTKAQALEDLDHTEKRLRFLMDEADSIHPGALRERLEQTLQQVGGVKRFIHNLNEE